jgi:hypothetical protein
MKNVVQIDSFADVQKMLKAILDAVGEKILNDMRSEKMSFADLGTVATTLQKLVDCYVELKPFSQNENTNTPKMVSRDVIHSIQTQLNLL